MSRGRRDVSGRGLVVAEVKSLLGMIRLDHNGRRVWPSRSVVAEGSPTLSVEGLGEAVGVEEELVAGLDGGPAEVHRQGIAQAERVAADAQLFGAAAGAAQQREGVAGADVLHLAGIRIQQAVE